MVTRKYSREAWPQRNHEVGEGGTETGEVFTTRASSGRSRHSGPMFPGLPGMGVRVGGAGKGWTQGVLEVLSPPDHWEYICETSLRI